MNSFNQILESSPVVLVEFYASWCPHCQKMMPIVDDVKELLEGSVPVFQFDIDEHEQLADSQSVETVPTFVIYRDGVEQWRYSGEIDGNMLIEKVNTFLNRR